MGAADGSISKTWRSTHGDLTDEEWDLIADLVPTYSGPGRIGRPTKWSKRDIVNAILYVAATGCQWRALPAAVSGEGWDLRCGDFREVLADVPDASVDAIVCDPPYPDEFLPLWSDLGAFAVRVLKPGRLLVAYCGHLRQLETMKLLDEHLEFVWVGATIQRGRHTIMRRHQIWTRHRPWLVFAAGSYSPRGFIDDTVEADGNGEKSITDHHWQQNLVPFRKIVSMVSEPGELVVDPLTGSGTTGVAALLEGRRFLGAEIDPGAFAMARERLGEPSDDLASF